MAEHVDESTVEQAAKEWFGELGYTVGYAPHDAPVGQEPGAQRATYADAIL